MATWLIVGYMRFREKCESESRVERIFASTVMNCASFCWIAKGFFTSGCSVDGARNALIFDAPEPTYTVEEAAGVAQPGAPDEARRWRLKYLFDQAVPGVELLAYEHAAKVAEVHFALTETGSTLPLVWFRRKALPTTSSKAQPELPLVLLHFHGDGSDIGCLMATYRELCRELGVDVVGVEYRGFGVAEGKPSVRNIWADALAAYNYVVSQGVLPEQIVAYGHCLGSGPTCRLAASRQLGGFVLQAPLLSAAQAVEQPEGFCRPSCCFCCCDTLRNSELMPEVMCPGLVLHGRSDEVVPCSHGKRLQEAIPERYRWEGLFPEEMGHEGIPKAEKPAFYRHLRGFLDSVAQNAEAAEPDVEMPAGFARTAMGIALAPAGPEKMV